jgi:hypothetical protein
MFYLREHDMPIDDQIVVGIVHHRSQVSHLDQLAVFELSQATGER